MEMRRLVVVAFVGAACALLSADARAQAAKTERIPVLRDARQAFLGSAEPPASTLVGVQALAREDFLIEIEAIAAVP